MRRLADRDRIEAFMRAVGAVAGREGRLYLTGGASAVLIGWRDATIDVDILFVPEQEQVFAALPRLKENLELNVELASPADFIPELPGWADRSPYIAREGKLSFHHYDFYSQALAKIERAHSQDLADVREMLARGLVDPGRAWGYFEAIEPRLNRYPAIDPSSFRRGLEQALGPS